MDLSILIVNWNSVDYLRDCLSSVYSNVSGLNFEVVVVDSASFDGCGEMLAKEFPQVVFVQSQTNLGFAGANNLAFEKSSGKVVFCLNPDTCVVDNAVQRMYSALHALPGVAAVGCKLLSRDRTVQTSCIQSFPTIANQLLDSEFLRKRTPSSRLWGMAPLWSGKSAPSEVEAISGAALMVKREAFERVGGFTEEYFMYSEDLDLCAKLQKAGFKNYYVPDATIVHYGGGSSSKSRSDFANVMMRESVFRFMRLHHGWCYALTYRMVTGLAGLSRIFLLLASTVTLSVPRQQLRKWFAIFKWSIGLQSWTSQKQSAKPSKTSCVPKPSAV